MDEGLLPYATEAEARYLKAINKHGGLRKAARELGRDKKTLSGAMKRLEARAASKGYAPEHDMTKTAAPGFNVKGVSTLYDSEGKVTAQWVKTQSDQDKQQKLLREAIESVVEEYRGCVKNVSLPVTLDPPKAQNRMVLFPIGDPHFGMHSWAEETGVNFNLKMAEQNLLEAIDNLIAVSPWTYECLIVNLGDYFHSDNNLSRTERSGAVLDVDTRWAKVLRVGFRALCKVVEKALTKYKTVKVINVIGNHDGHSAVFLSLALDAMFSANPRVKVELAPAKHHYYQFGKVLLGFHHGDTTKMNDLGPLMAASQSKAWGETAFRYWHCGHVHHSQVKEFPGVTVETHRTLAPRDAWHAGQGYFSGRSIQSIVYSKDFGEIMRHTVGVEMLCGNQSK